MRFFSTQIIHHLSSVVYSNFHTSQTWCGQYELCYIYWISIIGYISGTFWKGQLDLNPMSRQSELCSVHGWHQNMGGGGGDDHYYWRVVRVQGIGIIYKLSNTFHHIQFYSFVPRLRVCAVDRSYPRPLAGRLFYRFLPSALNLSSQGCKRCRIQKTESLLSSLIIQFWSSGYRQIKSLHN